MIDQIKDGNSELLKRCQYFTADRGYDDKATISKLWDENGIHPIIDNRMLLSFVVRLFITESNAEIKNIVNFPKIFESHCYMIPGFSPLFPGAAINGKNCTMSVLP